jgi:hypothetical protein
VYVIHNSERNLLVFTLCFLLSTLWLEFRITDFVLLLSSFIATQVSGLTLMPLIFGICVGTITYLIGFTEVYLGELYAVSSGILFQSVASQCLPLWDFSPQSKIGFRLSSIALVSLYMAACSIAVVI